MKRILLFMALISVSLSALAQDYKEFTGEGDGYSWEDPDNWTDYTVPQDGDEIYINGSYLLYGYVDLAYYTGYSYGSLELAFNANLLTQTDIWLDGDLYVDASSSISVGISQLDLYDQIYCDTYYFNGYLSIRLEGFAPQIYDSFEIINGYQGSYGGETVVLAHDDFYGSSMEATLGVEFEEDGIYFTVTDINYGSAIAWDGEGGDNNWTTASNWDPEGVPTAEDYVYINDPNGGYVNTPISGVTVGGIVVGRNNTLAINGDFTVDNHIYNNADGTIEWNKGIIKKSEDDYQSIFFNYGDIILDSPGLKELENDFEIVAFGGSINHNQGNLNINNGKIAIYNGVNYNINGDNITIGYSSGTTHFLQNAYNTTIKKTSGSGTSSINLTTLRNWGDIICAEGTLVLGEGVIEYGNSNIGGSGAIQFPPDFVLDSQISPGSSPGVLTIAGDLTTSSNATFNIEIDGPIVGTDYDRLVIENNADINATINVILGYLPPSDAVFEIVTAGTLITDNLPESIVTQYNGNSIIFNVTVQNNSIYLQQGGPIIYDCPGVSQNYGDACDDGDANTANDIRQDDCSCAGTLNPPVWDCPEVSKNFGDACDDGDPLTENDMWNEDCECEGIPALGYECATPISLECNTDPVTYNSDNSEASNTTGCDIADSGLWFTFIGNGNHIKVKTSVSFEQAISISMGSCDDLIFVDCEVQPLGADVKTITIANTVEGATYYVYVADISDWTNNTGDITISIECFGAPVFDCPGLSANIGDECNDGDPTTENDVITADCECAGTIIYDCPGLSANIGDACDDGNGSTENDVVTSDCECAGTIIYDCPGLSANIGDACDDGDTGTENDVITADCECAGTIIYDCPGLSANIGDACDDGDGSTENDVVTPDCECAGTQIIVYDCPDLSANIGESCDDGNLSTENDVINADCECAGTQIIVYDCPDLSANIGESCDDGNLSTENDVINADCECAGTLIYRVVEGTISWNNACGNRQIHIGFYNTESQSLEFEMTGILDSEGYFSFLNIESGTYNILIKVDGYLAKLIPGFTVADGTNNLEVGTIIPGDFIGDNNLCFSDISALNAAFGSTIGDSNYNPLTDVNCDGMVNFFDVSIISQYFGMQGDQICQ